MTKTDFKFFNKAKQVAAVSDFSKIHIGCVAVYQGNIIAIGCNQNKTHPVQKMYNRYRIQGDNFLPKLHAEINCINQLKTHNINFSKVKLYIYRIGNDRPYRMSRPCPSCMAAIMDLGIKEIYYTTNDGFVHETIINTERGVA